MVWYVKSENIDGKVTSVPCHGLEDVNNSLRDQRAKGREPWVEDANGKRVQAILVDESALPRRPLT